MRVQISDDYYIETDPRNYMLQIKTATKKKNGKENFTTLGYYGRLNWLYDAILEREIKLHPEVFDNFQALLELKENIMSLELGDDVLSKYLSQEK